jgi:hypothetical protein
MKVDRLLYPVCKCRNCGEYVVIKRPITNTKELGGGIRTSKNGTIHWCKNPPLVGDEFKEAKVDVILDIVGTVEPKERGIEDE